MPLPDNLILLIFLILVNLVPFGPDAGDHMVQPGLLTAGQTIDLHMYFPFYAGLYNYTTVKKHKICILKRKLFSCQ